MAKISLDQILNFFIPILVWCFLIYIIYKIPPIKEMVDRFFGWIKDKREEKVETYVDNSVRTIYYE
jgi:hypothetical protein